MSASAKASSRPPNGFGGALGILIGVFAIWEGTKMPVDVVMKIAQRVTVMARGAVLAEGPYEEVSRNPQVMEAYMGTTDGQLKGH